MYFWNIFSFCPFHLPKAVWKGVQWGRKKKRKKEKEKKKGCCSVSTKFTWSTGPVLPQYQQIQQRPWVCAWLSTQGLLLERTPQSHPGKEKERWGKKEADYVHWAQNTFWDNKRKLCSYFPPIMSLLTHALFFTIQSRCSDSRYAEISWLTSAT